MANSQVIVDFIEAQLQQREEFIKSGNSALYSPDSLLHEFSIIQCTGLRQSGFTTAIAKMFDPEKDFYIGHNNNVITEFKLKLKELGKDATRIKSLSFNNVKHSNITIDNDMKSKLNEYLNKLTVLHVVDGGIQNLERSKLEKDIYKIIDRHDDNYSHTPALRGKSIGHEEPCRIFIDLGVYYHQRYIVRVNKLIEEIYTFNTPSPDQKNNVVFILC